MVQDYRCFTQVYSLWKRLSCCCSAWLFSFQEAKSKGVWVWGKKIIFKFWLYSKFQYKRIGQIWRFAGKNYPDAVRRACFRQTQIVQGVYVPYSGFPSYSSDLISEHTIVRAGLVAKEVAVFKVCYLENLYKILWN